MSKEKFKLGAYTALILRKENNILLIRRCNTGSADGLYTCAGGKVDGNEPITQAMIREAKEEIGINLKKEDLKIVHTIHIKYDGTELIGFFIEAAKWDGEPKNMEPEKHDDLGWFDINNLPENTIPYLNGVLKKLNQNIFYSESGW